MFQRRDLPPQIKSSSITFLSISNRSSLSNFQKKKSTYANLVFFLFIAPLAEDPLLKAQSTVIVCVRNSAPFIEDIAFCASSKFSYSIRAYPLITKKEQ